MKHLSWRKSFLKIDHQLKWRLSMKKVRIMRLSNYSGYVVIHRGRTHVRFVRNLLWTSSRGDKTRGATTHTWGFMDWRWSIITSTISFVESLLFFATNGTHYSKTQWFSSWWENQMPHRSWPRTWSQHVTSRSNREQRKYLQWWYEWNKRDWTCITNALPCEHE